MARMVQHFKHVFIDGDFIMKVSSRPFATCLILGCISAGVLAEDVVQQTMPAQQLQPADAVAPGSQPMGTTDAVPQAMPEQQVQSVDTAAPMSTPINAMNTAPLPTPEEQNGVPYLSGGVGQYEARVVKQAAKDYDLMLTFATKDSGAYLADVNVDISDTSGKRILRTVSDGPILLAKLPPGTYKVKAEAAGRSYTKQVSVSDKGLAREVFLWPESLARSQPEPQVNNTVSSQSMRSQ
jgi:hypothetical protein